MLDMNQLGVIASSICLRSKRGDYNLLVETDDIAVYVQGAWSINPVSWLVTKKSWQDEYNTASKKIKDTAHYVCEWNIVSYDVNEVIEWLSNKYNKLEEHLVKTKPYFNKDINFIQQRQSNEKLEILAMYAKNRKG